MNNFKPGDQVDWATDFNDNHLFKWPGTVIGTFKCTAGRAVQFYVRKKGDAEGRVRVKEWLMCHLKPHQPKERWRWMKCAHLRSGMTIILLPERQYVIQGFSAIGPDQVICKVGNHTTIHMKGTEYIWAKEVRHD